MPGTLTYPMYACVETPQQQTRERSNSWDYHRPPPQTYATVRPTRISLPAGPLVRYIKTFIFIRKLPDTTTLLLSISDVLAFLSWLLFEKKISSFRDVKKVYF